MRDHLNSFISVFILAMLFGCNGDEPTPNESRIGFDFFPLQVGQSSVYDVAEIRYLITGQVDSLNFQLKVDVVDSFISQSGELNYLLHRFERSSEQDQFEFLETWSARVNANNAIESEGSTPFIRMTFPIQAGTSWDGNALNTLEDDTYVMDSLFSPYVNPAGDTIEKTLTVIEEDNQDLIVALDRRFNIYGEGIGLIYREDVQLVFCTDPDCIGQQIIESGREYRQTLVSHVKN